MTLSFLGTGFPHIENKSVLTALDRLLVADSQTNMWNHKQISFAQFQAIVASNVESVNGLTGIVSLGLTDLDDIPDPTTGSTFLSWNGSAFVWAGGGVGETNLAANVGSGADIFKDKTSVTFNFRGINGIQGIAAAVNSDNIDINFDVASLTSGQKTALIAAIKTELAAAIDVTDLDDVIVTTPSDGQVLTWNGTNWVNEDLPSSSGGFNINTLSLVTTSAAPANDMLAIYSASLGTHKKISITNLLAIAGFTGDTYFKISGGDTTAGYGATKLTATNGIQRIVVDPSADESLSFELDYAALSAAVTPTLASSYVAILDHTAAYKKVSLTNFYTLDTLHLLVSGGAMTGVLREAKSTNIASAPTTDLSTITGNLVHVTGFQSITSFGTVSAGTEITVVFDSTPTITHHATSLILPGATTILAEAGDSMVLRSEGSGNWKCIVYTRYSGEALVTDGSLPNVSDSTVVAGEALSGSEAVFLESSPTFAASTSFQEVGSYTENKRISFPVFGASVSASTLKLALSKVVSPSADLSVRIETDSSGSPSGTLAHANATGSVTAASLTTSLADTTVTMAGAFTLSSTQKYHIVVFQGTYGSETVNSTNYYRVGITLNNTATRFGKYWGGSSWSTGAVVNDLNTVDTFVTSGGTTALRGIRFLCNKTCILRTATKVNTNTATRCILKDDAGTTIQTTTYSGDVATFSPYMLVAGNYYKIESDNNGSSYVGDYDNSPAWPAGTNMSWISGGDAGTYGTGQSNTLVGVSTAPVFYGDNFPYASSSLFVSEVLAKTDSNYSYKVNFHGFVSEVAAVGFQPKVNIAGVNLTQSGLTKDTDYFLSGTPGGISSSIGTYGYKVGRAIGTTKIEINKFSKALGVSTSGVFSGTADTDIWVNAYGTGNGANTTLIGTSNGNVVASCSTGNIGGTLVFSICFPVKKGATWSVTGTMIGQVCWVTPLA